MSEYGDSEYTCTLTGDLLKKAQKELHEDPKTRLVEVKTLRKRVEKIPGLKPDLSFSFLLRFLRARKFDQERSYQLVKHHYEVKRDTQDVFEDLKPSRVRHVIESGVIEVLDDRDNQGCKVVVVRPGKWNPDVFPVTDLPKTMYVVLSKLSEDEETQVHGVHIIQNYTDVTMKHASQVGPTIAKKMVTIMQEMLPLRLKRLDICNEPTFFDLVFSILKQFMKKKFIERIHMNGSSLEKLYATIDTALLPDDLGGKQPIYKNKAFMDTLLTCDAKFDNANKFGFSNMVVGKSADVSKSGDAAMQGLGGTFKKLDI